MRITVIGSGNVAYHLATGLFKAGHRIEEIFGRNGETVRELAHLVDARPNTRIGQINSSSELYLCAVPDDAIGRVAASLSGPIGHQAVVAHTSGIHGLDVFPPAIAHAAVFYPLQTFTRGIPVALRSVPILIDARNETDIGILAGLAKSLSDQVVAGITNAQKAQLHLAAVFVNNFPNHLYSIAAEICAENGLDFDLLRPLMFQTVRKLDFMPPVAAQTGPAIRHDLKTIEKHRALLDGHPVWKKIYALITEAIAEK